MRAVCPTSRPRACVRPGCPSRRLAGISPRSTLAGMGCDTGAGVRGWRSATAVVAGLTILAACGRTNGGGANAQSSSSDTPDPGTDAVTEEDAQMALAPGDWHLLELEVANVGTSAGRRRLWIDGLLRADRANVDWSGVELNQLTLGEPWGTFSFQGDLGFDDVRALAQPPASHLGLAPGSNPVPVGECVPVTLALADSVDGAPSPAPYEVLAALSAPAEAGQFFSDDGCSNEVTSATLPAGSSTQVLYFRPAREGVWTLGVSHPDFLTGTTSLVATSAVSGSPSLPSSPSLSPLALQVGCAGAGGGFSWGVTWPTSTCLRGDIRRGLAASAPGRPRVRATRGDWGARSN